MPMIIRTPTERTVWETSDAKTHATLDGAIAVQARLDLIAMIDEAIDRSDDSPADIADWLIENAADAIIALNRVTHAKHFAGKGKEA